MGIAIETRPATASGLALHAAVLCRRPRPTVKPGQTAPGGWLFRNTIECSRAQMG